MRRPKLEINLDILKILAQKGPLKLTHIMYKVNVNCDVLKKYLEFLIKQGSNRRAFSWRRKDSLLDYASRFDIVQRLERIKAVASDG